MTHVLYADLQMEKEHVDLDENGEMNRMKQVKFTSAQHCHAAGERTPCTGVIIQKNKTQKLLTQ